MALERAKERKGRMIIERFVLFAAGREEEPAGAAGADL